MKKTLLLIAIAASLITNAQVNTVSLQASGLTCSMCSNAINKALKALDFVQDVDADMKSYTFQVSFKPNSIIDFDMLRKSVEKAGFTVCAFVATIHFDKMEVKINQPVIIQHQTFLFANGATTLLDGNMLIKFLDKGFVSQKEYKQHAFLAPPPHSYHVALD